MPGDSAGSQAIGDSESPENPHCATIYGNRFDNPADPGDVGVPEVNAKGETETDENGMTEFKPGTGKSDVRDTAVIFEFRNTPTMKVTYSVQCCLGDGRNFLFAGAATPLMPCKSPPPMMPDGPSPPP